MVLSVGHCQYYTYSALKTHFSNGVTGLSLNIVTSDRRYLRCHLLAVLNSLRGEGYCFKELDTGTVWL